MVRPVAAGPQVGVELKEKPSGGALMVLSGALDVRTAAATRREISSQLAGKSIQAMDVDASGIVHGDASGMVILYELAHGRFTPGVQATLTGLRPELEKLLQAFPPPDDVKTAERKAKRKPITVEVGAATLGLGRDFLEVVAFLGRLSIAFGSIIRRPRWIRPAELARVFEKAGANALFIVSLISLLTGLIIAFEAAQPLKTFGAQIYIANMIGLVMVRELGPIMTAIVFAGRTGSAFAAELGTMKVNEELDALRTMGLDPTRFLVVQRVLAGTLAMPLLTAYSMAMGILGGVIVTKLMGFPLALIWKQLTSALGLTDIVFGLVKAVVFGTVVSGLGCYHGVHTRQGPSAVGDSATRAVVSGILLIIIIDAIFSVFAFALDI
jgi:phospholipid/cholesterol/gamma-HCH transport system permease protein